VLTGHQAAHQKLLIINGTGPFGRGRASARPRHIMVETAQSYERNRGIHFAIGGACGLLKLGKESLQGIGHLTPLD
jgi:hypothetical protein